MLESQTAESLRTKIKEAPHWRVTIRPGTFVEERVRTLSECWRLIELSRVVLRWWDYPHWDGQHQNGKDWIGSWYEYESYREYWRFYQSGQFLHLFKFKEDGYRDKAASKAKSDVPALDGFAPSGYLNVVPTLWTITEIFEFAARLVQQVDFGDFVSLTIQMVGVKDRALYISDPGRDLSRPYVASESILGREWTLGTADLLGGTSELAMDAAEWFFERFQWTSPPRQVLAGDQRKLLGRQFYSGSQ